MEIQKERSSFVHQAGCENRTADSRPSSDMQLPVTPALDALLSTLVLFSSL